MNIENIDFVNENYKELDELNINFSSNEKQFIFYSCRLKQIDELLNEIGKKVSEINFEILALKKQEKLLLLNKKYKNNYRVLMDDDSYKFDNRADYSLLCCENIIIPVNDNNDSFDGYSEIIAIVKKIHFKFLIISYENNSYEIFSKDFVLTCFDDLIAKRKKK
ncbi:hypothetical protein KA977_05325 [Candidatus Dependentiae bacterium]|nr:hypothetical protein [Candidatus Dependentiae bacterium]